MDEPGAGTNFGSPALIGLGPLRARPARGSPPAPPRAAGFAGRRCLEGSFTALTYYPKVVGQAGSPPKQADPPPSVADGQYQDELLLRVRNL